MDMSVTTVVSLLMFFGRITTEKNRADQGLDPSVPNVFLRYGYDHCCSRIDNQTAILKGISFATEKLTKDVGKIKTGVEDDIPFELKRQAGGQKELSAELKRQAVGQKELSAELKRQAVGQKDLSVELKRQSVGQKELSVELKRQAVDLEKLSSELKGMKASVGGISISLNRHTEDLLGLDARVKEQGLLLEKMNNLVKEIHGSLTARPKDCSDIRAMGHITSGVFRVYPGRQAKRIQTNAYCDMTTPGGNWLVFQKRKDGSENFERTWSEYLSGFGNPGGEFWLGNEALYLLTSNGKYKLRIDMEDFDGHKRYVEYSTFSISSSADKYRLTVSGYSGNAGDSLSYHNGAQFSTKDADNDESGDNCAQLRRGAWWHKACLTSNMNGFYIRGPHTSYGIGINWKDFRGYYYSLKMTEMKIAAVN